MSKKKVSRTIKVKNNTANKRAREKYVSSLDQAKLHTPNLVEQPVQEPLPPVFENVSEAYQAHQASVVNGVVGEEMFSTCQRCNDEKVQKTRATEASRKAEMILVIRDIVTRFRNVANAKFDSLSADIQAQLKPIVEASNKIAITRSELSESLSDLEDNLKSGFGITDEIDPDAMERVMFTENEIGDPYETPEPGTDATFDKITNTVDTVLLGEEDFTDVESIFQERPATEAPLGSVSKPRKDEDRTKWN